MFFLAVIPLAAYFGLLFYLYRRSKPTVMKGSSAFILLAWGLFGLLTLGPVRLLIPMFLFVSGGYATWFCWVLVYFAAVQIIAKKLRDGVIVYHCQREILLPALYRLVQKLDEKAQWHGNVLSMPGYALQWTVTGKTCLVFTLTQPQPSNPNKAILYDILTADNEPDKPNKQ
ncbi:MAG: hypothetical protein LBT46_04515 [Planctomycetaceae bacterium]|jgi:hypothetical protein|nr:hypothetical protein [Planctomycetaceae bacterium]